MCIRDRDYEGWYAPVTVLRTSISERPFIVDSLREYLHDQDFLIEYLIYPVMHVERNASSEIISVGPARDGESVESLVYCEVSRITDAGAREALRSEASRRLQDVIRVTDDFHPMIDAVNSTVVELADYDGALPDLRTRHVLRRSPGRTGTPKTMVLSVITASGRSSASFRSKCTWSGSARSVRFGAQ